MLLWFACDCSKAFGPVYPRQPKFCAAAGQRLKCVLFEDNKKLWLNTRKDNLPYVQCVRMGYLSGSFARRGNFGHWCFERVFLRDKVRFSRKNGIFWICLRYNLRIFVRNRQLLRRYI